MNPRYPRRRWTLKRRIALVSVLLLGTLAGAGTLLVYMDLHQSDTAVVQGASQVVAMSNGETTKKFLVSEPLFGMELPGDWKEVSRKNVPGENSITWQATKKNEDNRSLKLYIDIMPKTQDVNKILPVTSQGDRLAVGEISENCVNFTPGSAMETKKAVPDKLAKWSGVEFICDTDTTIDNKIGVTSSEALNQITLTGSTKGPHKYFFVYFDRNIHPNSGILRDAMESFKAK